MFAGIKDNVVVAVSDINFSDLFDGDVIEVDSVDINSKWDGSAFVLPTQEKGYWIVQINKLYDSAMHYLQNGYSDEEVKTFTPKQDAIREYKQGGVAALSDSNRSMLEGLTGSNDDAVIAAKLDRMYEASATFKNYLGIIERLRDEHIDQVVDGQDNSSVVESLQSAYASLGG